MKKKTTDNNKKNPTTIQKKISESTHNNLFQIVSFYKFIDLKSTRLDDLRKSLIKLVKKKIYGACSSKQ